MVKRLKDMYVLSIDKHRSTPNSSSIRVDGEDDGDEGGAAQAHHTTVSRQRHSASVAEKKRRSAASLSQTPTSSNDLQQQPINKTRRLSSAPSTSAPPPQLSPPLPSSPSRSLSPVARPSTSVVSPMSPARDDDDVPVPPRHIPWSPVPAPTSTPAAPSLASSCPLLPIVSLQDSVRKLDDPINTLITRATTETTMTLPEASECVCRIITDSVTRVARSDSTRDKSLATINTHTRTQRVIASLFITLCIMNFSIM